MVSKRTHQELDVSAPDASSLRDPPAKGKRQRTSHQQDKVISQTSDTRVTEDVEDHEDSDEEEGEVGLGDVMQSMVNEPPFKFSLSCSSVTIPSISTLPHARTPSSTANGLQFPVKIMLEFLPITMLNLQARVTDLIRSANTCFLCRDRILEQVGRAPEVVLGSSVFKTGRVH